MENPTSATSESPQAPSERSEREIPQQVRSRRHLLQHTHIFPCCCCCFPLRPPVPPRPILTVPFPPPHMLQFPPDSPSPAAGTRRWQQHMGGATALIKPPISPSRSSQGWDRSDVFPLAQISAGSRFRRGDAARRCQARCTAGLTFPSSIWRMINAAQCGAVPGPAVITGHRGAKPHL